MKNTLFILCFVVGICASAQLHIDFEVANKTNEVFGLLDKSKIPHDMLLDYGYDFLEVTNYDGVLRDNNYIVPSVYRELYNSVVSMRTNLVVPALVDPQTLEDSWKSTAKSEVNKLGKGSWTTAVVVNGLYYHYSKFREDALDQGLIQVVDDKYYEDVYVNTEWQNPYETKEVFAMTLPFTRINNSKISLLIAESEWRTNQAALAEGFAVDFGDGSGYIPMELGKSLEHNFNEDGDYVWTFRLKLSDGTFRYCRTPVKITGKAKLETLTAHNPDCLDPPWNIDIQATKSYKGSKGSASVQIAPANECNAINRPLIVVEGFDSGLTGNHPIYGDTYLEKFLGEIDEDYDSEALKNLITEDNEDGFDIIYVNWDNGTDYLQRNAYVLEEVIRWVNQNKETDAAPNVVLGQSMGGVIARYALRDMENNNEDHDTSLYISHDAPHQGAHVPPGFFYMGRHALNEALSTPIGGIVVLVAGGSVPAKEVRQMMDSPAAKQLLINYVTNDYEIDTDAFDAWQNELKVMGYPQQTRNIAISNGSHCAQTYGIEPSQNLFSLHGSASFSPFTDLALHIFDLGWLTGVLLGDIPTIFLGKLFGQTSFHVGFDVWAFPEAGTEKIYNGWVDYEKKLLWVLPITHNLTSRSKEWDGNGIRLDDYPGGALPFLNTLKEGEESESNFLFKYHYNLQVTEDVSFIPTTSALDVGSGNTTLVEEDFLQTYTVGNPLSPELAVPFDNYTTTHNLENVNEMHITFNTQSGDWLANELNNTATLFDCSFLCNNLELEGGNTICKEEVYSVNVVGNTQIEWSSSNLDALTPMDPNSPSTLFVTPPNTYHQQVTIFATLFSPSCGGNPVVLEKLVTVGAPGEPADLYGPTSVVTGGLVQYFGGPAVEATSYEWRLPFPFDKVDQFDLFSDNWQIKKSTTHYDSALVFTGYGKNAGYVQLMGKNECGTGPAKLLYVKHASEGGGGGGGGGNPVQNSLLNQENLPEAEGGIIMFPNQAVDQVHFALSKPNAPLEYAPSKILGIKVYPQFQSLVKKEMGFKSGIISFTMDVSDLTTGYYMVTIETDVGTTSKILIVE